LAQPVDPLQANKAPGSNIIVPDHYANWAGPIQGILYRFGHGALLLSGPKAIADHRTQL
jgi:hypothetical protein